MNLLLLINEFIIINKKQNTKKLNKELKKWKNEKKNFMLLQKYVKM